MKLVSILVIYVTSTKHKNDLNRHIKSAHEGINFPCSQCGCEATTMQSLQRHTQGVHEGIRKFPCDLCDFKATRKDNLNTHKKNKH